MSCSSLIVFMNILDWLLIYLSSGSLLIIISHTFIGSCSILLLCRLSVKTRGCIRGGAIGVSGRWRVRLWLWVILTCGSCLCGTVSLNSLCLISIALQILIGLRMRIFRRWCFTLFWGPFLTFSKICCMLGKMLTGTVSW